MRCYMSSTDQTSTSVASTFIAELSKINFDDIPLSSTDSLGLNTIAQTLETSLSTFVTDWIGNAHNTGQTLQGFFAQFNQTTLKFPTTFSSTSSTATTFLSSLQSYLVSQGFATPSNSSTLLQNLTSSFQTFYTDIVETTGGSELSQIQPPPTSADLDNQFESAFSAFLQTYPYQSSGNESTTTFENNLMNFFAVSARVENSNVPSTVTLATYENIYNAFVPSTLPPGVTFPSFSDVLTTFYNQQISQQGYFIPSQSFGAFVTDMQQTYTESFTASPGDILTSVDTASSKGVDILNKVLMSLITMINALQNVAAAQAQQLNFLTQWQQAYTDLGNQVHYFVNGTDALTGGSKQAADIRTNLNTENQTYSQQIQANQNALSDNAKTLQSNVNQSNSAITNQANLGSTIFQQLSTILTSIFQITT
jgi:hypothetical protein